MKLTFLGTGTSHGVPVLDCKLSGYINCSKGVCKESAIDFKHKRSRCSVILEYNDRHIIIDISPDFREQMLRENISKLDAVLITHKHADHIMGIPDIRSYTCKRNKPLEIFASNESITGIRECFSYIFDPNTFIGGGIPSLSTTVITEPFELFSEHVIPIRVKHGAMQECYGYRIGDFAYIPDMKSIYDKDIKKLFGLKLLVIDCLRHTHNHSTHLILSESIKLAKQLAPHRCYFTHLSHDIHYKKDKKYLEPWMDFAYDGLVIDL